MVALLALGFPALLLALMLAMDRVESPLRGAAVGDRLPEVLEAARPDELEAYVREELAPSIERYWRRRGSRGWLPSRKLAARG